MSPGRLAVAFGWDPIRVAGAEDASAVAIDIGRTSIAAALDGPSERVEVSVDVGAVAVEVTGHDGERARRLEVDLAGVSVDLALDEGAQTLAVSGFDLGARMPTVKVDGRTVVTTTLNGAAGSAVDLELRRVHEPLRAMEIVIDGELQLTVGVVLGAFLGSDAGCRSWVRGGIAWRRRCRSRPGPRTRRRAIPWSCGSGSGYRLPAPAPALDAAESYLNTL